ncbi:MAG: hypothetical protein QNJ53_08950 [Pleurocapsa sp. MO_192.B19]|nr:hypothetical protein [Pleurocapsa sp. MO_192.B19]
MSNHSKNFLNNRVLIKGEKQGYCRICKQYGDLTHDHIPPKGSITISPVALRTLAQNKEIKSVIAQGGASFRTLCSNCNNNLLGKQYDPELNKVSKEVGSLVNKISDLSYRGFSLPPKVEIDIKPQRLARAVIGHLLASNYHPTQSESDIKKHVPSSEELRNFFLDQNVALPENFNIYYWFYPGNRQVLIREAFMSFYSHNREPLIFGLIKFAPIAYMLTRDEPKNCKPNALNLFSNRNIGIDNTEKIQINLDSYPRLDSPEAPNDDDKNIIFFDPQLTSIATKKESKKKGFAKKQTS